jgi:hypothetical protein
MITYADLQPGQFYLLQASDDSPIEMVSLLALTERCVLLRSFGKEEKDFWKLREEGIYQVIEEMDYDSAAAILSLYDEEEEDAAEEEDEQNWEENE